jgi:hypothetical protein
LKLGEDCRKVSGVLHLLKLCMRLEWLQQL